MMPIAKKYEKNIKKAYINPGFTLLIENFTKDFIFNFEVIISIHKKPELVPETLYKFIKICNSFEIFEIKDIKEVEEIVEQSVEIRFPKKVKGVYVDYNTLLQDESFFVYRILKKSESLIGLILTNIFLDSAYMDSVFRASKIILERVYKPETSIDEMIYASMVGITGGFAGNFNRVILFREDEGFFRVQRAIGPADEKEARQIYESFETLESNIIPYLNNYKIGKVFFSKLEEKIKDITISKEEVMKNKLLKSAISFNKTIKLPISQIDQYIVESFDLRGETAFSPMKISEGNLAFYLCDNRYNAKPISDVQLEILDYFTKQNTLVWQNKLFMNILKEEAELDPLTKVGNRRSYEKYISSLAYLKNMKIAFAFIDIDNFKEINDRLGHESGDKILKELSQIIVNNFRRSDKIFRYGGDEFIIILSNISKEDAIKVLDRLRKTFFEKTGCTLSVGMSFGNSNEIYSLFLKADENLYKAKKEDKNTIFYT